MWVLVLFVLALCVVGCGSGVSVPPGAVAVIAGTPISGAAYDRYALILAGSGAAGGKAPQGQVSVQAMTALIQSAWVRGEAKRLGITVTDAALKAQLEQTRKQSFPTEKAYESFLKRSGMTPGEVLDHARVQLLEKEIAQRVERSSAPVSQAQIAAYYAQHRAQLSVPERRDIEAVLTRTRARAEQAISAVQSGTNWSAAAKRFSADPAVRSTGGVVRGLAKGQEPTLDRFVFSARRGELVGPVRSASGWWYVVRVLSIAPARPRSLQGSTPQIRALIAQQSSQQKSAAFITTFQKRWRALTRCRTGYIVPLCSNAPKPTPTSTKTG